MKISWSEIDNYNLVFINFLPRSGSTYLCKLLDEFKEIDVGIDAGFPGYRKYLLPPKYDPIKNKSQLVSYLDLLFQDQRFKEWKINRTLFEKKLLSLEFPLKFNAVLLTALDEYFKESKASIRIHKADSVIDNWKEINELFPNSKSIYIVRDPKTIFRSQIEMLEILNNKNKNHIYSFITAYKSRSKLVKNYFTYSNFLLVKYEDLINNKKNVIDKILSFIELDNQQKKNSHNNYLNKIPYYERPIHTNINSEPLHANINKWENALNPWTISFIDRILNKEIKYFNYSPLNLNLENTEKRQYYELLWKYLIFSIKRIVVNILKYLKIK